ncbi:MAG: SDR family oxidoreductase [Bacteroidales bacterium]|jgi:NAD(P)-dependent dehydrogenase (short-subunit alcohol dehydrogenase family)|nr:SDR family oxidoreductase [Bacteroidales bacterium]
MKDNKTPFSLRDKTIIVTGASSGIGRQCAISCSQLGAKLILIGRNTGRLKETMDLLDKKEEHKAFPLDLLDYNRFDEALNEIKLKYESIDGIVNCAGISTTLPFRRVTPERMDDFFKNNVAMGFNLCRRVIQEKLMSNTGGSIIFISSVMGMVGANGKVLYGMTKGALLSGARSLALELAPKNIRVNCISPGVVLTPMSKNAIYSKDEESLQRIRDLHPLGLGEVEDVAYACVYLLSDASKWVSGSNLVIDGGYTAQ